MTDCLASDSPSCSSTHQTERTLTDSPDKSKMGLPELIWEETQEDEAQTERPAETSQKHKASKQLDPTNAIAKPLTGRTECVKGQINENAIQQANFRSGPRATLYDGPCASMTTFSNHPSGSSSMGLMPFWNPVPKTAAPMNAKKIEQNLFKSHDVVSAEKTEETPLDDEIKPMELNESPLSEPQVTHNGLTLAEALALQFDNAHSSQKQKDVHPYVPRLSPYPELEMKSRMRILSDDPSKCTCGQPQENHYIIYETDDVLQTIRAFPGAVQYAVLKCRYCPFECHTANQLFRHEDEKHDPPTTNRFRCGLCPAQFPLERQRKEHYDQHIDTDVLTMRLSQTDDLYDVPTKICLLCAWEPVKQMSEAVMSKYKLNHLLTTHFEFCEELVETPSTEEGDWSESLPTLLERHGCTRPT